MEPVIVPRQSRVQRCDETFINGTLATLRGWLFGPAAVLSLALLRAQRSRCRPSALVEIGVFEGRFLTLLRYASTCSRVIGIDTFQWIAMKEVEEKIEMVVGGPINIDLWKVNSQEISRQDLLARANGNPIRFISVDGDHAASSVRRDLELAESVLSNDGIVAADDFLNPYAIGATEGICSFFFTGGHNLVPFAFAGNKLFLCRSPYHETYTNETYDFVHTSEHLDSLIETRGFWAHGEDYYKQTIFNTNCLILARGFDT